MKLKKPELSTRKAESSGKFFVRKEKRYPSGTGLFDFHQIGNIKKEGEPLFEVRQYFN